MSGYTITLTDAEYDALKDRIKALEARCKAADELLNRDFPFPYDPVTYGPFYAQWTADRRKWLEGSEQETGTEP